MLLFIVPYARNWTSIVSMCGYSIHVRTTACCCAGAVKISRVLLVVLLSSGTSMLAPMMKPYIPAVEPGIRVKAKYQYVSYNNNTTDSCA